VVDPNIDITALPGAPQNPPVNGIAPYAPDFVNLTGTITLPAQINGVPAIWELGGISSGTMKILIGGTSHLQWVRQYDPCIFNGDGERVTTD
jgi:hypothetical protein